MREVAQFMHRHTACRDGGRWCMGHAEDLWTVWQDCPRGDWLVWIAWKAGVLPDPLALSLAARFVAHVRGSYGVTKAVFDLAEKALEGAQAEPDKAASFAILCASYSAACLPTCDRIPEHQWQADQVRAAVANPFKEKG